MKPLSFSFNFLRPFPLAIFIALLQPALSAPLPFDSVVTPDNKALDYISSPSAVTDDSYLLGPGDTLDLNIFEAKNLSGKLEILSDGTVPLPLFGATSIGGLTLQQAQILITNLMSQQLLRPDLQLKVVKTRPVRVALVGEVQRPGLYTLTSREKLGVDGAPTLTVNGLPTLVDAIKKAGGVTTTANIDQVVLQRKLPGNGTSYKQAIVDLRDVIDGNQIHNPFLFDGDIIRIDRTVEMPKAAYKLASSTLSPQTITVNVIGEVHRKGKMVVDANTLLVQAVLLAGGASDVRSNLRDVQLVRINRDGSAFLRRYTVDLAKGVSTENNPPLRDNDSIRVGKNLFARTTDVLATVTPIFQEVTSTINIYKLLDDTFRFDWQEDFVVNPDEED